MTSQSPVTGLPASFVFAAGRRVRYFDFGLIAAARQQQQGKRHQSPNCA